MTYMYVCIFLCIYIRDESADWPLLNQSDLREVPGIDPGVSLEYTSPRPKQPPAEMAKKPTR